MNGRACIAAGAALLLLPLNSGFPAYAQGDAAPAQPAPANTVANPAKSEAGPAKPEAAPAKSEASQPKAEATPAKAPGTAKQEPAPTKLTCRALRNDIGMYEPLRFISITVDISKKYVKMVHEGDGKIFEFAGEGTGKGDFVKITDESIVYGRQGRETWRIDRYTGTMTSSAFTIQFECQLRPAERKF